MRVVSVAEMREIERRAEAEYGLTSLMLMERAGQSVAEILRDVLQSPDVKVRSGVLDCMLQLGSRVDAHAHALAFSAAALPALRPKTTHSSNELPIMRFRPCVPPAISPQANTPSSVVSPSSSITSPPFW